MEIKVVLDNGSYMPEKAHTSDAGFDLFSPADFVVSPTIPGNIGFAIINTGVHMQIPEGYVGMMKSKSGLNVKHGLISEGVIDSGYTGSIVVKLYNLSETEYHFFKGDKISQIVILPIPKINLVKSDSLDATDRADNGFGSTGR